MNFRSFFNCIKQLHVPDVSSFIVPQEVPSLLSLVYSNIPPIKKGSDSRYGIGFRLGEHADFQVLLELGPQKYTRPIGQNAETASSKRETSPVEYKDTIKKTVGETWISDWSKNMNQNEEKEDLKLKNTNEMPIIPEEALRQLQQLYNKQPSETNINQKTLDSINPVPVIGENNYFRQQAIVAPSNKSKSKITAELMDVDFE